MIPTRGGICWKWSEPRTQFYFRQKHQIFFAQYKYALCFYDYNYCGLWRKVALFQIWLSIGDPYLEIMSPSNITCGIWITKQCSWDRLHLWLGPPCAPCKHLIVSLYSLCDHSQVFTHNKIYIISLYRFSWNYVVGKLYLFIYFFGGGRGAEGGERES